MLSGPHIRCTKRKNGPPCKVRETSIILCLCWMSSLYGKFNIKIIEFLQFN